MVPLRAPLFLVGDLLGFEGALLDQVAEVSQVVLVPEAIGFVHGLASSACST
jgi:hypothetical protein